MTSEKKAFTPPRDALWGVITGHALSLRKSRLDYMYACLKQYGDFLIMFLGRQRTILVNDPVGIKYVLLDNNKNYPKNTPGYKRVAAVLGQGVFTDIGEDWKIGRRVIAPTFNPGKFDYYFGIVTEESDKALANFHKACKTSDTINISTLSTAYALQVIGRSLFNENLSESFNVISTNLSHLIELTEKKMTYITPFNTPCKKKTDHEFAKSLKSLDDEIEKIILKEKQKVRRPKENMIHALLDSVLNFDDKKILSQVKTMVFAGHETTANVIIWSLYFLALYPEWQEKIYLEFKEKDFKVGSIEDLKDFVSLNQFLNEVLRLRPPAWSFGRIAIAYDKIHGEEIFPGDLISISPYLIHNHPDYWVEPDRFNPIRFELEPSEYTFIPYGLGPRMCMGEKLANLEMCIFLLNVIQHFILIKTPKINEIKMNPQVSLRPNQDIFLQVRPR